MTFSMPFHLKTGLWGENQAAIFLEEKGYKIIGRRFRVSARDEFDLIARRGNVLVFIEVKTRRTELFGRPASAVDRNKRHHLSRAAVRYLQRLKQPVNFRFDVVEVVGKEDCSKPVIRHIESAFTLDRCYVLPW
ncbi:MAG: YraN family protein [bacterium]|jgi:putative endonuclease